MISPSILRIKKSDRAALTVRTFVERHPEQVSEVWCRKLLRHLLHTLERQHAMRLPQRVITPDTIVFDENAIPVLSPSAASAPASGIGADLTALARVVHYAITQEIVPAAPLRGRALPGYSDSLITAIDRSLAFDPARRPGSVGELRDLLGIVVCARPPPASVPAHGVQTYPLAPLARGAGQSHVPAGAARRRRRVLAVTGIAVAVATLMPMGIALLADLRHASTFDRLVLTMPAPERRVAAPPAPQTAAPQTEPPQTEAMAAAAPVSPDPPSSGSGGARSAARATSVSGATPANAGRTRAMTMQDRPQARSGATGVPPDGMRAGERRARARGTHPPSVSTASTASAASTASSPVPAAAAISSTGATAAPDAEALAALSPAIAAAPVADAASVADAAPVAEAAPASGSAKAATRLPGAASGAVFELQIRPWGVVHVDGVRRGISPPIKRLVLAPGRHAILVTNPGSSDRALDVDTARGNGRIAVDFDSAAQ